MIISASRRTDIPTYYSNWFFNRIMNGYVLVRNPINTHQISKIPLNPDVVDGIVFWTKNPIPMLDRFNVLREYMYYFQFTLNSYAQDVETHVPNKQKHIIPAFKKLSDMIGPDRVIWRYDPIFLNDTYTPEYHIQYFEKIAKELSPYTKKCTISFIDFYRNTSKNVSDLSLHDFPEEAQKDLAKELAAIAHSYGLLIDTCAEGIELQEYGIGHARCIDDRLLSKLLDCPLDIRKDKSQRLACGCVESIDIGAYDTCRNGCKYCYANYSEKTVCSNFARHIPDSPLLFGEVGPNDKITERKVMSCKVNQIRFDM
ncbi:DUF1848 domain-containing protein [Anaeromassilibacillus sp. An200]|uniref:DUF1848 domain-containing protein n=1 Tax=Anaeromassilibacillus sp. An200 TaxID=1965587 RepID=UPI000B379761|nr:DUF1848 domain-containing protein [Anaeromassilibacillus sp. An200]OUP13800.1 hypothetical protein B5F35_02180 [Anaeromassilibacillus sp. An200]